MTLQQLETLEIDMVKEFMANSPDQTLEAMKTWTPITFSHNVWKNFVSSDDWNYKGAVFRKAGLNLELSSKSLAIKEINTTHNNKLITTTGKVVGISDVDAFSEEISYRCTTCNSILKSKRGKCCTSQDLVQTNPSQLIDRQIIKIQEVGSNPAGLTVELVGADILWSIRYGSTIKITGILKYILDKDDRYVRRLQAITLSKNTADVGIKLTDEDFKYIQSEIEQPQFWDKLVGSFAPHITGFREIKESIILQIVSTGESHPLNILLVGDASVAKSLLILYSTSIPEIGIYFSFAGAKWPSLSAHASQDSETKSWVITPGALALASGGLVGGDEMHAIQEEVANNLNEAGEQKRISYVKGGQVGSLPANCAWLFGANSYFSDWNEGADIQENLKFLGKGREALISRFALIFIVKDVVHAANDKAIALRILENRNSEAVQKYQNNWIDESGSEFYGFLNLRKILHYLRSHPLPNVSTEMYEELADWYVEKRQKDGNHSGKIKARNFDKAVFLAQLKAKILCRDKVARCDIDYAMELLLKNRDSAAFDPHTGQIDTAQLEGNRSTWRTTQRENLEGQFWSAFKEAQADHDGKGSASAKHTVINLLHIRYHWTYERAEKFFAAVDQKGLIWMKYPGELYVRVN